MILFGDRLACKIIKTNLKVGSIFIPPIAQKKTQEAKVYFVGDEVKSGIKPGDRILYDAYAGKNIKFPEGEFTIFKEEDILCLI